MAEHPEARYLDLTIYDDELIQIEVRYLLCAMVAEQPEARYLKSDHLRGRALSNYSLLSQLCTGGRTTRNPLPESDHLRRQALLNRSLLSQYDHLR